LSIFEKFNFKNPPVGVKFLYIRPEGLLHSVTKTHFVDHEEVIKRM